jgi:hypothetical protein
VEQRDVVVTWTGPFSPASPEWLRSLDFEVVWLDADRGAARPEGSRFVDPFGADGFYRPLAHVADELLLARSLRVGATPHCHARLGWPVRERVLIWLVAATMIVVADATAAGGASIASAPVSRPGVVQTENTATEATASGNIGSEQSLGCTLERKS